MSIFVTSYRATLCIRGNLENYPSFHTLSRSFGPWLLLASVFSSAALFLEEKSRRKEITLYAFVRGLYGWFRFFQRRGYLNFKGLDVVVFALVFGLMSMCYFRYRDNFSYANVFEKTLGHQ